MLVTPIAIAAGVAELALFVYLAWRSIWITHVGEMVQYLKVPDLVIDLGICIPGMACAFAGLAWFPVATGAWSSGTFPWWVTAVGIGGLLVGVSVVALVGFMIPREADADRRQDMWRIARLAVVEATAAAIALPLIAGVLER